MTRKGQYTVDSPLSPEQKRFALQLAVMSNVAAAARMTGISERTGRRWMNYPHVEAYINELRDQAFNTAMHMLEISTLSAVTMLNEIVNSEHSDTNQRLKASQILLDRGIEARKVRMLEERLQALEHQLSMVALVKEGVIVHED